MNYHIGASFNNWLDAVDKSFCTFEGGDSPFFVSMPRASRLRI